MVPVRRPARVGAAALLAVLASLPGGGATAAAADVRLELREGWAIQSSAKVAGSGEEVSRVGCPASGWHPATVPTTVFSALVADGTYPDPYYGMNLRKVPGETYKPSTNFSNQARWPPTARKGFLSRANDVM